MITQVLVDGTPLDIVSNVVLKRSSSSLVGDLTFSTPINIIDLAENNASISVIQGEKTYFNGAIATYSVSYSGRALSVNLTCSDDMSSLATDDRISFASGTMVGDAIVSLLANTGINTDYVALRSTVLPNICCVFPLNSNRLAAVRTICAAVGAHLYLRFDGVFTYAICDTWANLVSASELTEVIAVSDSTHLIINFSLDPAPEDPSTAKATIAFAGSPVVLYNQLNLLGLYNDMGISYSQDLWRITEIETQFSESGATTSATLTDPDVDLSDASVAQAATTYSIPAQAKAAAENVVDQSLGRIATVTAVNSTDITVTVAYAGGGEEENIKDWSV